MPIRFQCFYISTKKTSYQIKSPDQRPKVWFGSKEANIGNDLHLNSTFGH